MPTSTTAVPTTSKSSSKDSKQYCLFFNRFGRCSRGDKCPHIHDPKRVALCPRLYFELFFLIFSAVHHFFTLNHFFFLKDSCEVRAKQKIVPIRMTRDPRKCPCVRFLRPAPAIAKIVPTLTFTWAKMPSFASISPKAIAFLDH